MLLTPARIVVDVLHHHHPPVPVLPAWQIFPGLLPAVYHGYSGGEVLLFVAVAFAAGLLAGREVGFRRGPRHLANSQYRTYVRAIKQEAKRRF